MHVAALGTVSPFIPKKLLVCPHCIARGKKEVLGEIDSLGNLVILRFHKGSTVVKSAHFAVQCTCGEVVYQRGHGSEEIW